MKISYTKYGDYYLPDLTVPNKEYNIGRFGMMRLRYIKAHRSCFYTSLKLSGKLMDYIQETDNSAQQMYDDIISKFRKSIGSTCTDQMEWVRRMILQGIMRRNLCLPNMFTRKELSRE